MASFDRFPTRKGASNHIARFAPCLFEHTGGGLLYVLGDDTLPVHQLEDGVEILRFARTVPNLLERALAFGSHLRRVADGAGHALSIAHFRDPWSGVPLLAEPRAARRARARE